MVDTPLTNDTCVQSLQTGVEEFTFQLESTATGSFGFQVTGGYGSKIPATIDYIVPGRCQHLLSYPF